MNEDQADELFRDIKIDIEEIVNTIRVKKLRKGHTYVEDLIRVLFPYKEGMSRNMVLNALERERKNRRLPIPAKFEEAVQSAYIQNCLGYSAFKRRNLPDSDAPSYTPGGLGSGVWAVHPERVRAWVKKRREHLMREVMN